MKISVVIATYNGQQYLVQQLDTIREQTLQVDELIICDDGSTDDTVQVAEAYIEKYDLQGKWSVVVNEHNLGYANNFDKVASLATGELIFFSDQDDLWDLDKVHIMTGIMEERLDCKVLCTDYDILYDGATESAASAKAKEKMPNNGVLEKVTLAPKSVYIGALGCCMCVRRDFYHEIKKYWFDGWAQDDRMWRLSQCADGCYILHSDLIQHRVHGNNTATYGKYHTREKRVKLFEAMLNANCMMKDMLEDRRAAAGQIQMMEDHIAMMTKRVALIKDRKVLQSVGLVRYLKYYQNLKSYLVEMYIAMKK